MLQPLTSIKVARWWSLKTNGQTSFSPDRKQWIASLFSESLSRNVDNGTPKVQSFFQYLKGIWDNPRISFLDVLRTRLRNHYCKVQWLYETMIGHIHTPLKIRDILSIVARFEYEYDYKLEFDSVQKNYVMKISCTDPIRKYTSHRYENMHFIPNFRRGSTSGMSNKP